MADSSDQLQLKTQQSTKFACELKKHTLPIEENMGLHETKRTPHYAKKAYYAFLAHFGV